MKMWMKRGLSLLLAMVMTFSLLPVSALAARNTEQAETPVLDDTQGDVQKRGDGEQPEIPVDPDNPIGENLIKFNGIEVDEAAFVAESGTFLEGIIDSNAQDRFAILIVPRFTVDEPNGTIYTKNLEDGGSDNYTGFAITPGENAVRNSLSMYFPDMPYFWWKNDGNGTIQQNVTLDWNGNVKGKNGQTFNKGGSAGDINYLKKSYLVEWIKNKNLYELGSGTALDPVKDGLPFTVFFGGTSNDGMTYITIRIKVATNPLTVKIEANEQFCPAQIPAAGYEYGNVVVTNNSGEALTVTVKLNRGHVVFQDAQIPGWATTRVEVADDKGASWIGNGEYDEYLDEEGDGYETVGNLYCFDPEYAEDATHCVIELPMDPGEEIALPVIVHPSFYDVDLAAYPENLSDDGTACDAWSNYSAVATAEEYPDQPAWDDAGIHWGVNSEFHPTIVLVDSSDKPIPITGKVALGNSDTNEIKHTVKVGYSGTYFKDANDGEKDYYYLDDPVGNEFIYVDGIQTDQMVTGDKEYKIKLYQLTVLDAPGGAAEFKGSFNTVVQAKTGPNYSVTRRNATEFAYYMPGDKVYVYASSKGFVNWTGEGNVTEYKKTDTGSFSDPTEVMGRFNGGAVATPMPARDTTVYANYAPDITLVTTFDGDNAEFVGGDRDESHVYKIELKQGNSVAASAYQQTDHSFDSGLKNITLQEAGEPWKISADVGKTYTLLVNGVVIDNNVKIDALPTGATLADGTVINYVVELAGVTPKLVGATKETIDGEVYPYMTLPSDGNPDDDTDVTLTSDDPTGRTLYYVVEKNIPKLEIQDGNYNVLQKLEYPEGTRQNNLNANNGNYTPAVKVERGENDLIATYGQVLEIRTYINGVANGTPIDTTKGDIELKPKSGTGSNITSFTKSGNVFTSTVTLEGEYEIWVNGFNTGLTSKDTTSVDDSTYVPVPLQEVRIAHNPSSVSEATASSFSNGKYTNETDPGYIPNGAQITLNHGTATGWGDDTPKWTKSLTSGAGAGTLDAAAGTYTAAAGTSGTNVGAQTLTAQYVASTGTVKVQFTLNGTLDKTPVGSNNVYLGSNSAAGTNTATSTDGEYTWNNVGEGNYYIWVGTKKVYGPIALTAGNDSLTNEIKYWKVEFNLLGLPGTTPTTQIILDGEQATYPGNLSWTGYSFDGWFDDATSTTANQWVSTATNTVNTGQVWYARRTADSHTITYAPGVATGATIATADQTQNVSYGDTNVAVRQSSIITGTATGWNFVNWKDGGGTTYAGDGTGKVASITTSLTLTAQWTMDIKFDLNVPSGESTSDSTPATQKIAKGGNLTSVPTLSNLTHYNFTGWRTSGGTAANVTGTTTFDAPDTLYAVWAPKQYTVTWNGNSGTPSEASRTKNYGDTVGTPLPDASRTYYDFDGWYTAATGGTKIDGSETVTGNVTYYAHWTQKYSTVTVTLKKDSDTGAWNTTKSVEIKENDSATPIASGNTTSGVYPTGNLAQDGKTYTVYVGGKKTTTTVTLANATDGTAISVEVQFYTLTLVSGGNGFVDFAASAPSANGATLSKTELPGTVVNIAANPAANYTFGGWTGGTDANFGTGASTAVQTYTIRSEQTLTANFSKNAYNTYLYLTVNGTPWGTSDASATAVTDTVKIKSVELVKGKSGANANTPAKKADGTTNVTVSYDSGKTLWKAESVGGSESPYWKITTADGGVYYQKANEDDRPVDVAPVIGATAADDKSVVREPLFGVRVKDGAVGNVTNKPYLTDTSTVKRVVMPASDGTDTYTKAIHANPDTGYTWASWVKAASMAADAATSAVPNTVTVTAAANGTVELKNGYTSTEDLILQPTYTFTAKVITKFGGAAKSEKVTEVKLVNQGDNTKVHTKTSNNGTDGNYEFSSLATGATYDIYVNGFKVGNGIILTEADIATGQDVVMYQITTATKTTTSGTGTAYINFGGTASGNATEVRVPEGADSSVAGSPTITVEASPTTPGSRLKNLANDTLWEVKTGTATVANAATNATTTVSVTNVQGKIELEANVTKQFTATVGVSGLTNPNSTAMFKDKNGAGTTINADELGATVDATTYVKAVFTKGTGETLDGWTVSNGKLYTDSGLTNEITSTAGTDKTTTVYFVPTGSNATLTAKLVADKYKAKVKLNLNNSANGTFTVKLVNGSTEYATSYDSGTGYYVTNDKLAFNTNYTVYTNATGTMGPTGRIINFSAEDGEVSIGNTATGGNAAKVETELNYYTIVLKTDDETAGNTVKFDDRTATQDKDSKVVLAKKADESPSTTNIAVTATAHSGSTPYYRFNNWTLAPDPNPTTSSSGTAPSGAGGNYVLPNEDVLKANTAINTTNDANKITLTANFKKQYRVEVKKADTTLTNATVQIRVKGDTSWSSNSWVLVDEGGQAEIRLTHTYTGRIFGKWTIQSGAGTFTNGSGTASTTLGVEAQDYFAPDKDSVLLAHLWTEGGLKADWTYDPVEGTGTKGLSNTPVKELKWDKQDGSDPVLPAGVKVEKKGTKADYSDASNVTVAAGDLVQDGTDKTKYTFSDDFLSKLTTGTYRVTFTYKLGEDGNKNQVDDRKATAEFYIQNSKVKLTKVNIQVEDGTVQPQTGNPDTSKGRDDVNYKDYTAVKKDGTTPGTIEYKDLEFTWYYTMTKPGAIQKGYDTKAAAVGALPTGATEITSGKNPWSDGTNSITDGSVKVDPVMEGGYIFAVVAATDAERTTGAVITNVIPVDYNATITVKKDTSNVTADNYTVYLVPTTATVSGNTVAALTAAGAIKAGSFNAGEYSTTGYALTGGTSYDVWVNDAEGTTSYFLQATEAGTINPGPAATNRAGTVQYYSVEQKAFVENPVLDKAGNSVGETFTTFPAITSVTTANGSIVADTNGVHTGTSVTARSSAWPTQDYLLNWQMKVDTYSAFVDGDVKKANQTSAQASGTGATDGYTVTVNKKTFIGGRLDQKKYPITGDVKTVTGTAGKITGATLTVNGHTFDGSYENGGNGTIVTFHVPKSQATGEINGKYTIAATVNNATTLKGYSAPASTVAEWQTAGDSNGVTVTTGNTAITQQDKFTIFIEATELKMEVADGDNIDGHHIESSNSTTYANAGHTEPKVYANYDVWSKNITVTNTGNTDLAVTLVLEKSTHNETNNTWSAYTPIYNSTTDLGGTSQDTDTANGVTITGLEKNFTLDLGANKSKTFTVTFPAGLKYDQDVRYRFNLVTKDGRNGVTDPKNGPKVYFVLEFDIDPVTVTKVETTPNATYTQYTVTGTWIKENNKNLNDPQMNGASFQKLQRPQDASGLQADGTPKTDNDLVYEWYVCDQWDATVVYDETDKRLEKADGTPLTRLTNGVSKDTLTYDLQEEAKGKTLYLLVRGQNNAQGIATTPDVIEKVEPPMILPYTGTVIVKQNNSEIAANNTTPGGTDYKVYLWNKTTAAAAGVTAFDPTNTTYCVEATWKTPAETGKAYGYFTADGLMPGEYDGTNKTFKAYEYQVYTNTVKGNTTDFRNSGETINVAPEAKQTATVVYRQVVVAETEVNQNDYETGDKLKVQTLADNDASKYFFKTAPTAKPSAVVEGTALDVVDNWVQNGTKVTFTYPTWTKDYDLNWDGGVVFKDANADKPKSTVSHTVTYNSQRDPVTTTLKLNIYDVTANVKGTMGKVEYFSMILDDKGVSRTFTSQTGAPDADAILGIATSKAEIPAGGKVIFRLPAAGPYVTKATMPADTAAKLISYTDPDNATITVSDAEVATKTFDVTVDGDVEYSANLQGEGMSLQVEDNIPAAIKVGGVQLEASNPIAKIATASAGISPKEGGGVEKSRNDAVQSIKLYYNSYTAQIPVTLTFTNQSKHDEDGNNDLKNVKFVKDSVTAKPGGGDSITIDAASQLSGAAGNDIETVAGGVTAITKTVTLNIQPGLTLGTYTFVGTASFEDQAATPNTATTTYTLKVEIIPLPFDTVSTAADGSTKAGGYTVKPTNAVVFPATSTNGTAGTADDHTKLTHGTDYAYKWVSSDNDVTLTSADLTWNAATGSVTVANSTDCTGTDANSTVYTPKPVDQGRKLYLVIYALKDTNATGAAISDPITNSYEGIVYLKVDGTPRTGASDGTNYAVNFIDLDDTSPTPTPIPTAWKEVAGTAGIHAFVADLMPNTNGYKVQVSPAKESATLVDLGVTLNDTRVGNSLDHDPAYTNVTQAEYFTVTPKTFTAAQYKTGTGDLTGFDGKPIITVGSQQLKDAGTPVLKGQSVSAKANKDWQKDYKLLWQSNSTGTFDQTWATDSTSKQDWATAGADGAYTATINATTYIGGRLDQLTYTVVGTVKGTGGNVGSVTMAFTSPTEAGDTRSFTFKSYNTGTTPADNTTTKVYETGEMTNKDNDSFYGEPGDTITFTVVKGEYIITAQEGTNTTVQKVTIGGDGDPKVGTEKDTETGLNNIETLTPEVDGADRIFSVWVAARLLNLGVADSQATPETALTKHDSDNVVTAEGIGVATNQHEFFYDGTATGKDTFDLSLTNPAAYGTGDLKVKAEIFKFANAAAIPSYSDATKWNAPAGTGATYTDTQDSIEVLKITGLPTATNKADVPLGAGDATGTSVAGGQLVIDQKSKNKADAVYVIRYTSERIKTDGTVESNGPTVYYVLDLTVKPLPIVSVNKPTANPTTGALSVTDTGVTGVTVSHGATSADQSVANARGLTETNDVLYVWAKAPAGTSVSKASFTLADGADIAVSAAAAADGVELVTNASASTRSYTPTNAEQGMEFYLLAVRNKANTSNAADFAVSEVIYAQVTVSLKAYRTNKSNETPLTTVQIWKTDDTSIASNDKSVIVDDSGISINFTADKNDFLHGKSAGTTDVPADAKYYFHHWAVKRVSDGGNAGPDSTVGVTVGSDRLKMDYEVTEQATVIGYYDLLPELKGTTGYDTSATAYESGTNTTAERNARILTYTTNDGSGNVEIWIKPTGASTFVDGSTAPIQIANLAEVFETYPATGAEGQYVLKKTWITNGIMKEDDSYQFIFYDVTKGEKSGDDGYAGYDRIRAFSPVGGEKTVIAQVEDIDNTKDGIQGHGEVQVTGGSGTDGVKGLTSQQATSGRKVTVTAYPDDGYKFKEWKVITEDGGYFGTDDIAAPTTSTNQSDTFTAKQLTVTVEASFEPVEPTAEGGSAAIYFGATDFDSNTAITVTPDPTPGAGTQTFSYAILTEAELTEYLGGAARPDNVYTEDGYTSGTDPVGKRPTWLELNTTTGAFTVNGAAKGVNVRKDGTNDVTDELIVYVKVEVANSHATKIVPFTVDIMTTPLKIVTPQTNDSNNQQDNEKVAEGTAYKTAYVGAYGTDGTDPDANKVDGDNTNGKIIHGGDVELGKFAFTSVVSTKNGADELIAAGTAQETVANIGKWEVTPEQFNGGGTDPDENSAKYIFTFTYTGDPGDPSDDYNYKGSAVEALIPVQRPARSLEIADELKVAGDLKVGTAYSTPWTEGDGLPAALGYTTGEPGTYRKGETLTYLDEEPTYIVKLKRTGSLKDVKLELAPEEGKTIAGFNIPNDLAAIAAVLNDDGTETSFELTLAPISGTIWVGEHYVRFKLSGLDDLNTEVAAYYTLSVTMNPKVITELNVELTEPEKGGTPDTTPTVTGKDGEDLLVEDDGKGNTPVKPEVTWYKPDGVTPMDPNEKFGEDNYPVKVVVTVDPNYIYAADDPATDDRDEDIVPNTALNGSKNGEVGTEVEVNDEHTVVTIEKPMKAPITIGATFDGFKREDAGQPVSGEKYKPGSMDNDKYPMTSQEYGEGYYWAAAEDPDTPLDGETTLEGGKQYVLTVNLRPDEAYKLVEFVEGKKDLAQFNPKNWLEDKTDLTGMIEGVKKNDDGTYTLRYHFTVPNPSSPPPVEECPCKVFYWLGLNGTTADSTIEDVSKGRKPGNVPEVNAVEGYKFLGWSLTLPVEGKEPELVDPATVSVSDDTTFYAVYEQIAKPVILHHTNYIVGFPDGTFRPTADITRAQVATIIARAILPDFVEGADYGNIGGYTDVTGHWAQSAIAYCTKYGVFKGYEDDTFRPNRPISRQELALVVARLDGVEPADGTLPFDDAADVSGWALDGVYAAYTRGLVVGYEDNTFKPLDNIHRDETVTIFNRYLKRGVDAEGLADLKDYLYGEDFSGGDDHYMIWPDVPKSRWSFYEVVEASNDHEFHYVGENEQNPPEHWDRCWIDGTWDDGSKDIRATATSMVSSSLRISAPIVGAEAQGQTVSTVFAGMVRPPVWVSKDMEVWF